MRTTEQRKRRKTIYRVLSVAFVLIGVAHAILALMQGIHDDAYQARIDVALLWLLFGATWVALSRLWGELADESAAAKKEPGPTS